MPAQRGYLYDEGGAPHPDGYYFVPDEPKCPVCGAYCWMFHNPNAAQECEGAVVAIDKLETFEGTDCTQKAVHSCEQHEAEYWERQHRRAAINRKQGDADNGA